MASLKPLNGIAHDIAHHAQSGLSWLHPHIGEMCRKAGVNKAIVEVAVANPYPLGMERYIPLELGLQSLHKKFLEMLQTHSLSLADVASLQLEFKFAPDRTDDFTCSVKSTLVGRPKKIFTHELH